MNKYLLSLLLLVSLNSSGCATIFSPSSDTIIFNSNPSGASVKLNGNRVGTTPVTVPVERELSDPTAQFTKDGFESQFVMLNKKFNNTALLNLLFWPGFIVDALTGSLYRYSTLTYDVELDRKR